MSVARARTPRFRPALGPGLLGLYPAHAALSGLVAGLLAGPRLPAVVVALAVVAAAGGVAALLVPAARIAAVAFGVAVAILLGAVVADARLAALDRTTLQPRDDVRATAEKILAHRDERGGFGSVEELGEVSGIGEKRLASLREQVRV